jgi:hypothetical protein
MYRIPRRKSPDPSQHTAMIHFILQSHQRLIPSDSLPKIRSLQFSSLRWLSRLIHFDLNTVAGHCDKHNGS